MLSESPPLAAAIEFGEPGDDLELYLGPGHLDDQPIGTVRVWVTMRTGLKLRWRASAPVTDWLELGTATLSIDHPVLGILALQVQVNHSDGWGTIADVELGGATRLDRVIVHWVNLPFILPTTRLSDQHRSWLGRWQMETHGWRLTLDCRQDHSRIIKLANELDEQFVITHIGELRRVDAAPFDTVEASEVMFGWQLALSFALGRWVAPAVPVGFDSAGNQAWQQWAPWRCDTLNGHEAWWDSHAGEDLKAFVGAFVEALLDPARCDEVRLAAMHVVAANHGGTTAEGKVMLVQAGLEYLAWVRLVLSGQLTKSEYKAIDTAERLRLLLSQASIPTAVPDGLDGLFLVAQQRGLDGPAATTWVRNRLVHPKDPGEPYRIQGLVWQTAQLLLEYAELLLLHGLGYNGRVMPRYPPGRFAHSSRSVPWTSDASG